MTKAFISMLCYFWVLVSLFTLDKGVISYKVSVIGASSGVGQLVCSKFIKEGCSVTAIGRNKAKLDQFSYLSSCNKVQCSTKDKKLLADAIKGADSVVISVGTTAFPTKAWENGQNTPKIACYDAIVEIIDTIKSLDKRPEKIALLTSIGVERKDQIPFKILNSFGVLTEKKRSEDFLTEECLKMKVIPIICRPGRLIGEPFTNLDLAKLLKVQQKQEKLGITLEKSANDCLAGDIRRKDVANSLYYLLRANFQALRKAFGSGGVVYSIVNHDGDEVTSAEDWNRLLL